MCLDAIYIILGVNYASHEKRRGKGVKKEVQEEKVGWGGGEVERENMEYKIKLKVGHVPD